MQAQALGGVLSTSCSARAALGRCASPWSSDTLLTYSTIQQSFHLAKKIFKHENLTKPSTQDGVVNSGCNLAAASRINSDGKVGSGFATAGLSRRLASADAPSFFLVRAIRNACPPLSQAGNSAASGTKVS